jgi:uncharacterized protein YcbX
VRLGALYVYPLKGAGGISVESWPVGGLGLQYDRRWMLVTPAGMFLTQRDFPRLCLVRTEFSPSHLVLAAPGMPTLRTSLAPTDGATQQVEVWRDRCRAWLPDPDADRWCSEVLGTECRLAYLPEESGRALDSSYDRLNRRVGFADAFPFLLIGAASLEELNRRLAQPLPMNRFRPNLVIEGSAPFAEDGWRQIRIGTVDFDVVKPCARCVVTTTDQNTGQRGQEPLRTLATFRRVGNEVWFGQNAIHRGPGKLAVGDAVEVVEGSEDD